MRWDNSALSLHRLHLLCSENSERSKPGLCPAFQCLYDSLRAMLVAKEDHG